jgi:tetratricopeptide (TPR) repeat protein
MQFQLGLSCISSNFFYFLLLENGTIKSASQTIERSISYFDSALQVYTLQTFPEEWAITNLSLGLTYIINSSFKDDYIKEGIGCINNSLQVFTQQEFPMQWAFAQQYLAMASSQIKQEEKIENWQQSFSYYQNALQIFTIQSFPQQWAFIQILLGNLYSEKLTEKNDNYYWGKTIFCYQSALQVLTPQEFPDQCFFVSANLGNLAFEKGHWKLAIKSYDLAIQAIEILRNETQLEKQRQQHQEIAITMEIYQKIIQSYLNLGQSNKAIEYIERSKARNLVELLATRNLYPKGNISLDIIAELDRLRREIATEQKRLSNKPEQTFLNILLEENRGISQFNEQDDSYLQQLKQELEQLITHHIAPIDPTFSLTQKVNSISFEEIKNLLDEQTAIIQWYITHEQIFAFIITSNCQQPIVKKLPDKDVKKFFKRIFAYLSLYTTKKKWWHRQLTSRLTDFAKILHLEEIIAYIPSTQYQKIILIPHLFLHYLPIHALFLNNGTCLLDHYSVTYNPSCQLLQTIQNRYNSNNLDEQNLGLENNLLFGIQNPSQDLIYTDIEVSAIRKMFQPKDYILVKEQATKTNFKNNHNL